MRLAHTGLKRLFEEDYARGLPPQLAPRIRGILAELEAAQAGPDMRLPGYRLHALRGDRHGFWSVRVSGNWRIIFRFIDGEAADVELIDYR